MARVTGPLMSFDASGTVAGAIVFSKWRGRNYVRRHAVPANPRSVAQVAARAIIAFLGSEWAGIAANSQATWEDGAESEKISPFNQYVKLNARNWRDQFAPSQPFPALRTDTPGTITSISATVSGRQVSLALALTPSADAWGIVICRALTTGFTSSPSNAIGIIGSPGATAIFVDGPLAPDEYFYNAFLISKDGLKGAQDSEDSATVV